MPILHRHVVPNVPAWTADNGKIVFRNGAPSHRADLSLFASFGGSIGFNDDGDEPVYPPVTNFATSYTLPSKSLSSARATPFQYDAILSRQTDADDVERSRTRSAPPVAVSSAWSRRTCAAGRKGR